RIAGRPAPTVPGLAGDWVGVARRQKESPTRPAPRVPRFPLQQVASQADRALLAHADDADREGEALAGEGMVVVEHRGGVADVVHAYAQFLAVLAPGHQGCADVACVFGQLLDRNLE